MIASLISEFAVPLFMALLSLIGGGSLYYAGKIKGKTAAEVKAVEKQTKEAEAAAIRQITKTNTQANARVDAMEKANAQTSDVNAMSDTAVADELRRDYSR